MVAVSFQLTAKVQLKQERKLASESRSFYTLAVIIIKFKTSKNAIVEYLDYQIPVTQL